MRRRDFFRTSGVLAGLTALSVEDLLAWHDREIEADFVRSALLGSFPDVVYMSLHADAHRRTHFSGTLRRCEVDFSGYERVSIGIDEWDVDGDNMSNAKPIRFAEHGDGSRVTAFGIWDAPRGGNVIRGGWLDVGFKWDPFTTPEFSPGDLVLHIE